MNSILTFIPFLLFRETQTKHLRTFGGNPIIDPIIAFFRSIWNGLAAIWRGLAGAIIHWFNAVFNYNYAGIPIGPVIFVAISIMAFFMIWGFMKLRRYLRTD